MLFDTRAAGLEIGVSALDAFYESRVQLGLVLQVSGKPILKLFSFVAR